MSRFPIDHELSMCFHSLRGIPWKGSSRSAYRRCLICCLSPMRPNGRLWNILCPDGQLLNGLYQIIQFYPYIPSQFRSAPDLDAYFCIHRIINTKRWLLSNREIQRQLGLHHKLQTLNRRLSHDFPYSIQPVPNRKSRYILPWRLRHPWLRFYTDSRHIWFKWMGLALRINHLYLPEIPLYIL